MVKTGLLWYTDYTIFFVERWVNKMNDVEKRTDEPVESAKNAFLSVAIIVGIITIIAGIAVAVYKYLTPDYLDDFDEFDDDFDDDFFDDDQEITEDVKAETDTAEA
jgi:hypothetical protein